MRKKKTNLLSIKKEGGGRAGEGGGNDWTTKKNTQCSGLLSDEKMYALKCLIFLRPRRNLFLLFVNKMQISTNNWRKKYFIDLRYFY